jgi:peptidoglycan hydrolase-like protein with peptidoglycan-binding domain
MLRRWHIAAFCLGKSREGGFTMLQPLPYVGKLIQVAKDEFEKFHELDENEEPLRSRINDYCRAIGVAPPHNISEFPWSATFVSFCVKTAGATAAEFKFSAAHAVFVQQAIVNADHEKGVFRARPIDEHAPQLGDIIQNNRGGGTIDYDEARRRTDYVSHSAIVVDFTTDSHGSKFAVTIGGNESDSVRRKLVPLTDDGFVQQRDSNPYICVIEDLKQSVSGADMPHALAPSAEVSVVAPGQIVASKARAGIQRVHGPVVEALQLALIATGSTISPDGDFGSKTLEAFNTWQASHGQPRSDGITANQWSVLTGGNPPSLFDLCLQLTASFEGTGFKGAVGNFDGAGVTFGIIGFTAKDGELGRLVADAKRADPTILTRCFGDLSSALEHGLGAASVADRVAFGASISTGTRMYNLQEQWRQAFERFGSEPTVKRLQLARAFNVYWTKAKEIFARYDLTQALDAALAYDIAVQNGGVKASADEEIRRRIAGVTDPQHKRTIIAEEVRDAAAARWRADVFSRKSAIATGSGLVHSAHYELVDWGLDSRTVSTADLDAPSELRFDETPVSIASGTAVAVHASPSIMAWEDDPEGGAEPRTVRVPDLAAGPLLFNLPRGPAPGLYQTGTPQFRYWTTAEALQRTADYWAPKMPVKSWQSDVGPRLSIALDEGEDLNAFYDREALRFFHGPGLNKIVFSAESADVACHELGHAILDSIQPQLWHAMSHEAAAFHEAFGDISAILSALQIPNLRSAVLTETRGQLARNSRLSRLAEQLGAAIRVSHPELVDSDALRNAANSFVYQDPLTLPSLAPATQLSSEPHMFSRVFTGAFLTGLAGMLTRRSADPTAPSEEELLELSIDMGKIVIGGVQSAAVVPSYFAQVAAGMIEASRQFGRSSDADALRDSFISRGILTFDTVEVVDGLQAAAGGFRAAVASSTSPLDRIAIDARKYGLETSALVVHSASQPRRYSVASIGLDRRGAPATSSETAARGFVDDLFRRSKVEFDKYRSASVAGSPRPNAFHTHKVVRENDSLMLVRRLCDCGLCGI